jgi:hypothetical protein
MNFLYRVSRLRGLGLLLITKYENIYSVILNCRGFSGLYFQTGSNEINSLHTMKRTRIEAV